jgi:hypothetical protein
MVNARACYKLRFEHISNTCTTDPTRRSAQSWLFRWHMRTVLWKHKACHDMQWWKRSRYLHCDVQTSRWVSVEHHSGTHIRRLGRVLGSPLQASSSIIDIDQLTGTIAQRTVNNAEKVLWRFYISESEAICEHCIGYGLWSRNWIQYKIKLLVAKCVVNKNAINIIQDTIISILEFWGTWTKNIILIQYVTWTTTTTQWESPVGRMDLLINVISVLRTF